MKRRNPVLPLGGGRWYAPAFGNTFGSHAAYMRLRQSIGASAATTYHSRREFHTDTAQQALAVARAQVTALGREYPGGIECVPYRTGVLP